MDIGQLHSTFFCILLLAATKELLDRKTGVCMFLINGCFFKIFHLLSKCWFSPLLRTLLYKCNILRINCTLVLAAVVCVPCDGWNKALNVQRMHRTIIYNYIFVNKHFVMWYVHSLLWDIFTVKHACCNLIELGMLGYMHVTSCSCLVEQNMGSNPGSYLVIICNLWLTLFKMLVVIF